MLRPPDQILSAAGMRGAEAALIAAGTAEQELMRRAGQGAAEWVWRIGGGGPVTVLAGPGNNGGDGYVIAKTIRERGGEVRVIAPLAPRTAAAAAARAAFAGEVLEPAAGASGAVFVDCLFGSGLDRPLAPDHAALLRRLAAGHSRSAAIDLPSGVESDLGHVLNDQLPDYDLTLALGAWKFAHFLMPACAKMGAMRLVDIGIGAVSGAAGVVSRPALGAPAADAHKYRRGLLGVAAGAMPGAALLAARAAQGAGAGYVRLLGAAPNAPADIVADAGPLARSLEDPRLGALLAGPGLGRGEDAAGILSAVLAREVPAVLDADALVLLCPALIERRAAPLVATPHEGELAALEGAFALSGAGGKVRRAAALADASGMIVIAKGPDTVIAAPGGRLVLAPRASSWLSAAGTGDVLAGIVASRLACGVEPFAAAGEGVWLHGAAAQRCPPPFTAGQLAEAVQSAYAACL